VAEACWLRARCNGVMAVTANAPGSNATPEAGSATLGAINMTLGTGTCLSTRDFIVHALYAIDLSAAHEIALWEQE
jgi:hypothetical protein